MSKDPKSPRGPKPAESIEIPRKRVVKGRETGGIKRFPENSKPYDKNDKHSR